MPCESAFSTCYRQKRKYSMFSGRETPSLWDARSCYYLSISMGFDRVATHFITNIPASCSLSTTHFGGTPMAQTNKAALLLIMISISSGS